MNRDTLIEFIEDYAAAKATGRVQLVQFATTRLNAVLDVIFAPPPPAPVPSPDDTPGDQPK